MTASAIAATTVALRDLLADALELAAPGPDTAPAMVEAIGPDELGAWPATDGLAVVLLGVAIEPEGRNRPPRAGPAPRDAPPLRLDYLVVAGGATLAAQANLELALRRVLDTPIVDTTGPAGRIRLELRDLDLERLTALWPALAAPWRPALAVAARTAPPP